jgi:L-ribulokinase
MPCALGLDFGTSSVRALVVDTRDGRELGTAVAAYRRGEAGIVTRAAEPELARQHPADHLDGLAEAVRGALAAARDRGAAPADIAGLGVDATGSTPLPLDAAGQALGLCDDFTDDPAALAWLWKDHTSTAEAAALTAAAREQHPEYLAKCGGEYSSEWYWAKAWRAAATTPHVAAATHRWLELADWIPAVLCGTTAAPVLGLCAAGHKGLHHPDWGGFPAVEFLGRLHPELARWRRTLEGLPVRSIAHRAGRLTADWAARLGLPAGLPVAVGAIDAHLGAVGAGIRPGRLVKILGTSTCDMLVAPLAEPLPDVPGICGIAPESILPGHHGLEAGQSAVGDLFQWFVGRLAAGTTHEGLAAEAARLAPGASGLLALDWNHGNRCLLCDPRLSGLLVGQTLATRPAEVYRALVEATAFGARMILERFEEHRVPVTEVVNCGGIAEKSPLTLQIYADVTGRPMRLSRSGQTCALGAAIAGAVAGGAHPDVPAAQQAMTGLKEARFAPRPAAQAVYERLFRLYRRLHDAFGRDAALPLGGVMKDLLGLRDAARRPQD